MCTGCRCENVVFVFVFFCLSRSKFGAPCIRGVHSSNKHCVVVYCPISTRFAAFFFQKGLLFQKHYIVLIFVARWCHNFREIAVKNCENPKNRQKSLCTYRQLRVLKKILLQQFRAETVDVHLYKFFSAHRYIALIASVKFRIGGPKTARNVQVCAQQKSYKK